MEIRKSRRMCLVAILLVGGMMGAGACASDSPEPPSPARAGRRVSEPVATAEWHLPGPGFMQDVGWPSTGGLQVEVLDTKQAMRIHRALSKYRHPELDVPSMWTKWSAATEWRIPVQKTETCVRLSAYDAGPVYDVDLSCDGRESELKVPKQGFLLLSGFPTNASLLGLIELR